MNRAHWELSLHIFFMPWQPAEPEDWPTLHEMLFQLLASMLMIVTIAALRILAVISRCIWMHVFLFAGSRPAPPMGKRLGCAATTWKMALLSATLNFWGLVAPNLIVTMVCSFRWFMSSHLMMLMLQCDQNFIALGGLMQLSSEHHCSSGDEQSSSKKKKR